jgi:hypothetical protein
MKKKLPFLILFFTVFCPILLEAHVGSHGGQNGAGLLTHFFLEHGIAVLAVVGIALFAFRFLRRRS